MYPLYQGYASLVSIQHDTPRHRAHGYFRRSCNLASVEAMWAHFTSVAVHPSQLRITGYPRTYDMHIIKLCCCRQLQIDWQNIVLWDLDCNLIKLPALGKSPFGLQMIWHPLKIIYPIKYGYTEEFWIWSYP